MDWVSYLWRNGHKGLVGAGLYFVGSLTLLAAVSLGVWLGLGDGAAAPRVVTPLVVTTPFTVLSHEVHPGRELRYLNSTCNGIVVMVPGGSGIYTNEPGCHHNEASIPLPPEVGPGTWYRTGKVVFIYGGEEYTVTYGTEPFEVVP